MEHAEVIKVAENIQELLEHLTFPILALGPEPVPSALLRGGDNGTEQVRECPVGIAFRVEVDPCCRCGKSGNPVDIRLRIPDSQRLQGVVMYGGRVLYPLASFAGAEGARKLGRCKDSFPIVLSYFLLAHASEEAQVVLVDGLVAALLPELANVTMVVENELWRGVGILQFFQFRKNSVGIP
jgi:hypothetical protein